MTLPSEAALPGAVRQAGLLDLGVRVDHVRFHRKLRFGSTDIQSAMDVRDPDILVLDYTRLMMAFLLFQPRPQRMLMIGLGGGSLPKFCHRHLPACSVTVVEIDPAVIALRDRFDIPVDQPGFQVIQADGTAFVAEAGDRAYDVILVDGFEASQMPAGLGTLDFYLQCARLLQPSGVMVCNLHLLDIFYSAYLDRIDTVFDRNTLLATTRDHGNAVVFARLSRSLHDGLPRRPIRPATMATGAWSGIESDLHDVLRGARRAPRRA